jgi:hypothetical protein
MLVVTWPRSSLGPGARARRVGGADADNAMGVQTFVVT